MAEAFIVDAVRTPVGRRGGSLASMHSADLGGHVLKALVDRTGIDAGAVDDVIMGCCDTIGSQAGDVARTAWLVAGLPDHVPGVTIDRQCGSSQQSVHFAAQGVLSGTQDLVIAGGLQNMSAIPISAAMLVANGVVKPYWSATSIAAEIGIAEMFWRPPATTRCWVPDITPWAAKCTDCCDEPHWRSMVTPGT